MGRVLCQSYYSLDSNSFSVWTCGMCCRHEMMWSDLGLPEPRWITVSTPTSISNHSSLLFFFFKEPIVEPFCSGNATIVGASFETKTRPYHLSDRKRRTHVYAWERETGELREWKKRASVNATEGLFSSGSSFSPRHDSPYATRATAPPLPKGRR